MITILGPLLSLLTELVKAYESSGGPDAVNRWLNDKIKEVQLLQTNLPKPDGP